MAFSSLIQASSSSYRRKGMRPTRPRQRSRLPGGSRKAGRGGFRAYSILTFGRPSLTLAAYAKTTFERRRQVHKCREGRGRAKQDMPLGYVHKKGHVGHPSTWLPLCQVQMRMRT
ncbi:hypothetical protein GGTG_08487 [Gaeumannomyces tritici R3-111a-1]|uniref:Uncharacterized protein n=1 Tax=Gaeumannomyces tritici (strain R3-111a-1) TaxID=644352 RepID=J3P4Q0_GAET3|nr:hypothetical protein GGTG_08487 [Gaeumannomyces tritici R3-111a-1]EJT74647.1 hypothetical protein GGTG_08487 [Gaeumannomyces tritici R3-111a-1]